MSRYLTRPSVSSVLTTDHHPNLSLRLSSTASEDVQECVLTHIHRNCDAHACLIKQNSSRVKIRKHESVGVSAKALCKLL